MGNRREQMTIVGPDFRLARPESRGGRKASPARNGTSAGGERISMARFARNSDR